MVLYEGSDTEALSEAVKKAAEEAERQGRKAGIIDFKGDVDVAAKLFFKELRACETEKADIIIAAGVSDEGLGEAVMNRMRKAAGDNIIYI